MKICVTTRIHPTEDKEKVLRAVRNVFKGEVELEDGGDGYYILRGCSESEESLSPLYHAIRATQAISAARAIMMKKKRSNTLSILIHKQAAYAGKISFIDSERESPLGPIIVTIEVTDPNAIIDWLAPELNKTHHKAHRDERARRKRRLSSVFGKRLSS